ncbi:hypothetical protein TWF191_001049 [Orbilia oligospora]|uniref:Uncharacterized protein n=1 Tax=Orbilia oligospora TaxID=2813651 RepID=A0A7C8UDZ4_ORBOL|nr:hypothetical protein TWF191_001049 [Orbilia oligospora]
MLVKEHLNQDGLRKIVSIKAALNRGLLSDDLKLAFPDITSTERPLITDNSVYFKLLNMPKMNNFLEI